MIVFFQLKTLFLKQFQGCKYNERLMVLFNIIKIFSKINFSFKGPARVHL